jgi:hypothetical protein
MTPQELLNAAGIHLKSYAPGNHTSICPNCSANRKPQHRKLECVGVKIDDRGATWHCNHCGDIGPPKGSGKKSNGGLDPHDDRNFVAKYDYIGFQKVRYPKGHKPPFAIRHREGNGWGWGAGGADTDVLYRKDEIDEAISLEHTIVVPEGEKDVESCRVRMIPATCNAHGASEPNKKPKWKPAHSEQLRGADIVVVPDHDPAGYAHAEAICRMSLGIAQRVRLLKLADHWPEIKEGGDISDWFAAGHSREELDELISRAPDYKLPSANDGAAFGYSWQLIWDGEASSTSGRKELVQDLLPETGVALISGQWGTYKTFIADDLCAAVMTGTTFANRQVMRMGGVLFIACEGQTEVPIRLPAAFRKHGGTGNAPFAWVQGCPRLLDPNAGKILAAMVKHAAVKMMQEFNLSVAVVIIDTAGKAAGLSKPGELYDDAVAKIIMSALAEASIQTGALFVGVAHFGKNKDVGTKGSTGFEDDADVVLALLGERGLNGIVNNPALCVRKRKSGANGEEFPFQTEEAEVDNEKTLTIRWTDADDVKATAKPKKKNPWAVKSLRHLHKTMTNVIADCGSEQQPYADGPIVRAVDLELVRAEFYKSYPATGDDAAKKEARKKAFSRATTDADDKDLIGIRDLGATTFIWFAQAGG